MDEIVEALKVLKKAYLSEKKTSEKSLIISKWIYILERAYDILETLNED